MFQHDDSVHERPALECPLFTLPYSTLSPCTLQTSFPLCHFFLFLCELTGFMPKVRK